MNMKSDIGAYLRGMLRGRRRLWISALALGLGLLILIFAGGGESDSDTGASAEEQIEARLEELCSSIDGVGRCRVMVSCVYEYQGYGREPSLQVVSVAIVCRGADRTEVRQALTELIRSLYGLGSNRISISRGSP